MNPNIEILQSRINSLRNEAKSANNWGAASLGFFAINASNIIYNLSESHELNQGGTIGLLAGAATGWSTIIHFRKATALSRTADSLEGAIAQHQLFTSNTHI